MSRRRLWISLLLTLVIAWGSLAGALAAGWNTRLGLDLQGGFSVLLTAPEGTDAEVLEKAVEIMRRRIENLGAVQEPEISVQGGRSIQVQLPGVQERDRALEAVGTTGELSFRPVLASSPVSPAFTDGTLPMPEGLLEELGVEEDDLQLEEDLGDLDLGDLDLEDLDLEDLDLGDLDVDGDELDDTEGDEADRNGESEAGATRTDEIQGDEIQGDEIQGDEVPADEADEAEDGDETDDADDADETATTTTTTEPPPLPDNMDPETGLTLIDDPDDHAYLSTDTGLIYHVGPAFLTGSEITGAEAGFTGGLGASGYVVDPSFTADGAVAFEEATAELSVFPPGNPRRSMAIVVDGRVVSAPQIAESVAAGERLDAGQVNITIGAGAENGQAEAEDLATILRYGALPTTFERERVESVSASLGSDSLRAGLIAGLIGLSLVALVLVLYYRALGLVALLGLTVFGSLLMLAITVLSEFQGTTLTLAGVTGIIVSIGVTTDSYIVYFERIKEAVRQGKALRPAVDQGFKRAFRTILTADTVTFTGSVLLWFLAIGPVKGFALTLGLATVVDVIVAYTFTRPATMLLVRGPFGEGGFLSIRGAMGGAGTTPATPAAPAAPAAEVMS